MHWESCRLSEVSDVCRAGTVMESKAGWLKIGRRPGLLTAGEELMRLIMDGIME